MDEKFSFLIYGHNGWIGTMIINYIEMAKLPIDIHRGKYKIEIDSLQTIEDEIKQIHPTHIICSIGRTHGPGAPNIDYLEPNDCKEAPEKVYLNVKDNLFAPVALALICQKHNIHLTYIGTGCIYDDSLQTENNKTPYSENSIPNYSGSSYSAVKSFTNQIFHLMEGTVLNARIRMPITNVDNPRNFISKIIRYKKVVNMPNSLTVVNEIIPMIIDTAMKKKTGTINFTNPGTISHNEILELYKSIVDNNFEINNMTIEEQNQILKSKRSNCTLSSETLTCMYQVDDAKTAITKCLQNWIPNNSF